MTQTCTWPTLSPLGLGGTPRDYYSNGEGDGQGGVVVACKGGDTILSGLSARGVGAGCGHFLAATLGVGVGCGHVLVATRGRMSRSEGLCRGQGTYVEVRGLMSRSGDL